MGRIPTKIMRYITKVKKKYGADAWLFGSRASGTASEESDYDLCFISKKFENMPLNERLFGLYKLMIATPFNADVLAVTPKEFNSLSKKITIYKDISEKGVKIC